VSKTTGKTTETYAQINHTREHKKRWD